MDEILTLIEGQSPHGARRVKARIHAVINLLLLYPESGRLTNRRQLRRLMAYPYPYIVFYRVIDTEIIVHGVRHAARDPRSMPE